MNTREIQDWLVARIATGADMSPDDVNVRAVFSDFGLDSTEVVVISGQLEELLNTKLSPALLFDYPTIELLSRHLSGEAPGQAIDADFPKALAGKEGDIAIVGIGCRFPNANGPQEFWKLLTDGKDAIREIPPGRWEANEFYDSDSSAPGKAHCKLGGFLSEVEAFDADFFSISAHEAKRIDPQQRILLEVAWEALEDAQEPPVRLAGAPVGVFVGISVSEHGVLQSSDLDAIEGTSATSSALSIAANRVSYCFNFRGPSMAIDSACSSSLVAVHQACASLRSGESLIALAGGVSLIFSPALYIGFTKAGVLAPDGKCKSFDGRANGYARGEGCGVVVLKRLAHALADRNPIYAVIRGSAVNQDGRSNGLMAPSQQSQEALLRRACHIARVLPSEVHYVEAHGAGTMLGDTIEAKALSCIYNDGRSPIAPLRIGSVKTNIGHLEAAAGIAGLIKVALSLKHRTIPPSLNFKTPNPHIDFGEGGLEVQRELTAWPKGGVARAGVSSFGFGGTNAHAILEEAPETDQVTAEISAPASRNIVLPLSARDPEAIRELASRYSDRLLEEGKSDARAAELCVSAALNRSHHSYRVAVSAHSAGELLDQLKQVIRKDECAHFTRNKKPQIALVFSGQGAQFPGVSREWFDDEPVFFRGFKLCADEFRLQTGISLVDAVFAKDAPSTLAASPLAQPAIFCFQIALAGLLRHWGINAQAAVGHSVGEVAAAHFAGCLSLSDAVRVIHARSIVTGRAAGRGGMLATKLSETRIKDIVRKFDDRLSIAAINSPGMRVVSGDSQVLAEVYDQLQNEGEFARLLPVTYPAHSRQMLPFRSELLETLDGLDPRPPALPIYSTVSGNRESGPFCTPHYWAGNMCEPVLFASTIDRMCTDGYDLFIELSSHPLLEHSLTEVFEQNQSGAAAVSTMRNGWKEGEALSKTLCRLYEIGCDLEWQAIHPLGGRNIQLPTYPWRHHYYRTDRRPSSAARVEKSDQVRQPPLRPITMAHAPHLRTWEVDLSNKAFTYLRDHTIHDSQVLPASLYIELALSRVQQARPGLCAAITNIKFERVAFVSQPSVSLQITLDLSRDLIPFTVHTAAQNADGESRWIRNVSGTIICESQTPSADCLDSLEVIKQRCLRSVSSSDLYRKLDSCGLKYGKKFRCVQEAWSGEREALGRIRLSEELKASNDWSVIHPALLDASLHLVAGTSFAAKDSEKSHRLFVPIGCKAIRVSEAVPAEVFSHVTVRESTASRVEADVRILDSQGRLLATLESFTVAAVDEAAFRVGRNGRFGGDTWLYRLKWRKTLHANGRTAKHNDKADRWLIFADRGGIGHALAEALENRGERCVVIDRSENSQDASSSIISAADPHMMTAVIRHNMSVSDSNWRGVVHLWSLDAYGTEDDCDLNAGIDLACGSTIALVKSLSQAGPFQSPRLWLVTRGAQHVHDELRSLSITQAPLWGLAKVIAFEHPELRCTRIDLDPEHSSDDAQLLCNQLLAPFDEDQIAVRSGAFYVPRIAALELEASETGASVEIRHDATYIISGGLGGLGITVARALSGRGARHLVLFGRSAPSKWALQEISILRARGVEVITRQADVSLREDVERLLRWIDNNMPPLRGFIHAAGTLADAPLLLLDNDRFWHVMRPKAVGAWNFHILTQRENLDFFVLFSSAASILGSPGQANYAAANAFLDALAYKRSISGQTALTLNWGPWSDVGLAAAIAKEEARSTLVKAHLVKMIEPNTGIDVLNFLMNQKLSQVLILPYDLKTLLQHYPVASGIQMFSELPGESVGSLRSAGGTSTERLYKRPRLSKPFVLLRTEPERLIAGLWQRALDIERVGALDDLFELGGDSVLATQLIAQIEKLFDVHLVADEAYKSFTVEALASAVEQQLKIKISALDESEVDRLLSEKVALDKTTPA